MCTARLRDPALKDQTKIKSMYRMCIVTQKLGKAEEEGRNKSRAVSKKDKSFKDQLQDSASRKVALQSTILLSKSTFCDLPMCKVVSLRQP